jgi:predicted GIY-YIG superfamily endonuclease
MYYNVLSSESDNNFYTGFTKDIKSGFGRRFLNNRLENYLKEIF